MKLLTCVVVININPTFVKNIKKQCDIQQDKYKLKTLAYMKHKCEKNNT